MAEFAQPTAEQQTLGDHADQVINQAGFWSNFMPESMSTGANVLGLFTNGYGMYSAGSNLYHDVHDPAHFSDISVGSVAKDGLDFASNAAGFAGSAAGLIPGEQAALEALAGPTPAMLSSEVTAASFLGEAGAGTAVAAGTAAGTAGALIGSFLGGMSMGEYADNRMKDLGVLGEGVGLADAAGRFGGDVGSDTEWALNPYIGDTASSIAGTAVQAGATAGGVALGTLATPYIALDGMIRGGVQGALDLNNHIFGHFAE